jgi:predicted RNA polymerase sigma factor
MGQRVSRAKETIRSSGVPFDMPRPDDRQARLAAVLHVLYLIFNEGYTASSGAELHRMDLAVEAIRIMRQVRSLLPHDGEVSGLLALMLLIDARRRARTAPGGDLVPLADQDRSLWDEERIAEGRSLVTETMSRTPVGPYQLQAAIAALHDEAPSAGATDWRQILALYRLLDRFTDNPMVTLNQAVALAMVEGPTAGLGFLEQLEADKRVAGHHRLAAVRGHMLEESGDHAGAIEQYRAAARRTTSLPERRYLERRAAELANRLA